MKVVKKMLMITVILFATFSIGIVAYLVATNPVATTKEKLIPPSDFRYFTTRDGIKLYYQTVEPKTASKGMVVCFQGINGGGYKGLLNEKFAENGFSSYIIHQRGTGYSEGVKGDLETFDIVVDDYQQFLDFLKKENPHLPLFILGHSLGGDFCIQLAGENKNNLAGVILINPATKYQMRKVPISTKIKFMLDYIFRRSALTIDVSPPQKINNQRDQEDVERCAQDKLTLKRMSTRYGMAAQKLWENSVKNASTAKVTLLVIYSDQDEVIDHTETERVFAAWKNADKTKVIVPGVGHSGNIFEKSVETIMKWTSNEVKTLK